MENVAAGAGPRHATKDGELAGATATIPGECPPEPGAGLETVPDASGGGAAHGAAALMGSRPHPVGPSRPADDIPFGAVDGNVRALLQRTAPFTANVVFDQINRLKQLAYEAQCAGDAEACVLAARATGQLALKTLELTVGKQVNVTGTIRSQADIPNWDRLPLNVRQRYLETLETAQSLDGGETIVEGEVVPQTDEAYPHATPPSAVPDTATPDEGDDDV